MNAYHFLFVPSTRLSIQTNFFNKNYNKKYISSIVSNISSIITTIPSLLKDFTYKEVISDDKVRKVFPHLCIILF